MGGRGTASGLAGANTPRDSAAAWAETFGDADTSTARDARRAAEPERTFPDTPTGTHEYRMGGAEKAAVDWFKQHTNFDELIRQMSYDERSAFTDDWAPGHFMDGKQYRGFSKMSPHYQEATRVFDKYLDRATLDAPVQVVRLATPELLFGGGATSKPTAAQLRALEGQIVTSTGNMSCAAAAQGLTISWTDNPGRARKYVEYKFHIPGGTTGAGMWIGDKRTSSWGAKQREFLMNRDTAWRVGKATYDSRRGCYVVEMEWVGLQPHDYS